MSASNQVIDNDTPLLESSLVTPPVNYDLGARPDAGVRRGFWRLHPAPKGDNGRLCFSSPSSGLHYQAVPGPALAHCGHHNGLRSCKILSSDVSLFTPNTSHLCWDLIWSLEEVCHTAYSLSSSLLLYRGIFMNKNSFIAVFCVGNSKQRGPVHNV